MDELKICFIINENSKRIKKQIETLNVPENYVIEIIEKNMCNVCKAYNEAMTTSKAKYKIYISDDVEISNRNIIEDMLSLFKENAEIGLIGADGSCTIPTTGIWQDSIHKFSGNILELKKSEQLSLKKYKEVKAVGKLFIATQYDVYWREDLFDSKYFYNMSQCIEFQKKRYKNVVPIQSSLWISEKNGLYETEKNREFYKYRNKFLDEYYYDIFPLVSILIPTYNRPDYFKIALESALNQTYRNIEIVICDDSTNGEVKRVVESYLDKYSNIKYYNNGGPLGKRGLLNILKCFEKSSGEYINYLLDDDVFHLEKIEKMMNYYIEYEDVKLVTSNRELIDEAGKILPKAGYNTKLFEKDTIIDGSNIGEYILKNEMVNVIGELTTVLLRRTDIENSLCQCFKYQCRSLGDLGMWIELLSKGRVVYISEALSCFRIHEDRNTNNKEINLYCIIDYYNIIMKTFKRNLYLKNKNEFVNVLINYYKNSIYLLSNVNFTDTDLNLKCSTYKCLNETVKTILSFKEVQ